ncbi:MAG: hypothetical protein LBV57_00970 [Candidatus Symbiothrix sp.]|jgi:hypothetical protein|nr:hypothetical protein [Candidatus Symbiothrix sp.]
MQKMNELLIKKILSKVPKHLKPIDYLKDELNISKESVYRRMRGEISFTLEEVSLIAKDLKFSIDELMDTQEANYIFLSMMANPSQEAVAMYEEMLTNSISLLKEIYQQSKKVLITMALTSFPFKFFSFENLFRFEYALFLHQQNQIPFGTSFSDILLPPAIKTLHQDLVNYVSHLPKIVCVVDDNIFSKLIKKIKYYYDLKFISNDDLQLLYIELTQLLKQIEKIVITGESESRTSFSVYYSLLSIDTACIHYEYDDMAITQLWLCNEMPIILKNNPAVCLAQKKQLESQIKYSTLITSSNTMLQAKLLRVLRNCIEELNQMSLHESN